MVEAEASGRDQKLLGHLATRNVLIPDLIARDHVYNPRTRVGAFLLEFLADTCISPDSEFSGQRFVEQAIKEGKRGAYVAIASDHISDADHAIRRYALENGGYEDFANATFYAAGLKMRERKLINALSGSENQLYIPTPFDLDELMRGRKRRNPPIYTEAELDAMKKLSRNYHNLVDAAKAKLRELTEPGAQSMFVSVYPEATRSRDGLLGQARLETASWYVQRPGGFVLPVATLGGEQLLPAEKPQLLSARFLRDRAVCAVRVGKMIATDKIVAFSDYHQQDHKSAQLFVDTIMAHVAVLMGPEKVPVDRWKQLMQVKSDFESFCVQNR